MSSAAATTQGHSDAADVQMWLIKPMNDGSLALEPERVLLLIWIFAAVVFVVTQGANHLAAAAASDPVFPTVCIPPDEAV